MRKIVKFGIVLIHVVAPDEGKLDGKSVWELRIDGTPDPLDFSKPRTFRPNISRSRLCDKIRRELNSKLGSEIVDECWPEFRPELEAFYDEYLSRIA